MTCSTRYLIRLGMIRLTFYIDQMKIFDLGNTQHLLGLRKLLFTIMYNVHIVQCSLDDKYHLSLPVLFSPTYLHK